MIPRLMQNQLQSFYDLELNYNINDFLITDRGLANQLESNPSSRSVEEKLLIQANQDGLGVSLFLAEELIAFLDANNPFIHLDDDNLNAFCIALEGVSHFTYLTWNASHNRPISQLELELQAEIDKFVSIVLLARKQDKSFNLKDIYKRLFTNCKFDQSLDTNELDRYQTANNYAARYCTQLEYRYAGPIDDGIPRRELCRFYRKRHLDKLSKCHQLSPILPP